MPWTHTCIGCLHQNIQASSLLATHQAARVGLRRDGAEVVAGHGEHDAPRSRIGLIAIVHVIVTVSTTKPKPAAYSGRTRPRGSASGGMGPKWSPGTVTMMRPEAALARPARTARSVVNASSGRSLSLMRCRGTH